jgi:hypothetical protein
MTSMISDLLSNLYGIILDKKIAICLEGHEKIAKGRAKFRIYHSIVDPFIILRIIVEECFNSKTNILFCFCWTH